MTAESLSRPPGYLSAVPFDKQKHRRLGVSNNASQFARALNVIYLTHLEIARACLDYPVAFAERDRDDYVPIAVTGVEPGINLLVDDRGNWDETLYCPAYVRRYPFFLAAVADDEQRGVICVDEHALSDQAPELINALGEPTAAWDERLRLIEQFDVAERKTRDICRRLLEFELFEPFDADFHPNGKQATKLVGLARINKARIDTLEAAALKEFVVDGTMRLIDAHLLSLQRFDRILNLAAAR